MGWGQDINWVTLEDVKTEDKDKIVFVIYTAEWCAPCKRFRKILNNNAKTLNKYYYPVKFIVNKDWSNVKENVKSIPLVRLYNFEDGRFKFVEEFDGEYDDENTKIILNYYKGE
jgi:thiol-disulfide isomerase/thioredoxin